MNRELKRVSVFVLLMFVALFTSSSIIQVFEVDSLRADDRNVRTLYASYSAQRGPILVDGEPIAESVPADDQYKFLRTYPGKRQYAPITGYLTLNGTPTGIEGALNDQLTGTANSQFFDQLNSILTGQDPKGDSVELTIDPDVQQAAWDALGDNEGAVVALNPKTGAILAMVSKPTYDPNILSVHDTDEVDEAYEKLVDDDSQPLANRAIAGDLNPPGSVFKLIVTSAALESGKFTPESEFDNPVEFELPESDSLVRNSDGGACGPGDKATIATGLRLSCNTVFAQLGIELGEQAIGDMARAYGFDQELEIPLQVTPSHYPRGLDDAQTGLSAFGQYDDRATPLQIAMVSAAIANGGQLMKPTLVESVLRSDLSVAEEFSPEEFSRPISDNTSTTLTAMMVEGVANGAASNARIDGVSVAGKTGTAENDGDNPYTLWFTGFAPADDPQYAITVLVEDGGGLGQTGYGNLIAAPIAQQVLEAVLNK